MPTDQLITWFLRFGLAALVGFVIGLEREMRDRASVTLGIRDFVLFALLGALSSYAALQYDNPWLIPGGLLAFSSLVLSSYWANRDHGSGITTEIAAVLTFLLGVLISQGAIALAIALAILMLVVLFPKQQIKHFRAQVQFHEMRAVLLFLTITFIVLPVLPRQSLDASLSFPAATLTEVGAADQPLRMELLPEHEAEPGQNLVLVGRNWEPLGSVEVTRVDAAELLGRYRGESFSSLRPGVSVRQPLGVEFLEVMLSALKPYKIWLIVVLVSFISFVGYVLIKVIGSGAGVGLTGLIGGLVSSTVTTLSFARRSLENPEGNRLFAMAIIVASSVMFPRLVLEIAVVNPGLMRNILVPLGVMGLTGFTLAYFLYRRARSGAGESVRVRFENPFSLKSAVTFGLVFAAILMATRLATTYLGNQWLPAVAIVSGLTDADAIAFSLSSLEHAGLISTDWASFNLVLGALSNTFMKLFLVLGLGDRRLFRHLLASFLLVGAVGLATMFLYYDLGAAV
jgi:uncharacterized membrane protein (DUF4010 family)